MGGAVEELAGESIEDVFNDSQLHVVPTQILEEEDDIQSDSEPPTNNNAPSPDSNATTVDDNQGEPQETDSATSLEQVHPTVVLETQEIDEDTELQALLEPTQLLESQRISEGEPAQVQPTQILESQLHAEPSQRIQPTQILEPELHAEPSQRDQAENREAQQTTRFSVASVRAQSLRNSALAAYRNVVAKLEKQPEAVDDSASYVLQWGRKQNLMSPGVLALPDKTAGSVVAETAGPLVVTPVSQQLNNVTLLCSNNKKSTELVKLVHGDSPLKTEYTLDRVRKVLFEDTTVANRDAVVGVVQTDAVKKPSGDMSYLNSQEPGEQTQANALDALDRLVSMCGDFSQEPQVSEFHVEPAPNLQLHTPQLQRKESSVYNFMASQADTERRDELAIVPAELPGSEQATVAVVEKNREPAVKKTPRARAKTPQSVAKTVVKRSTPGGERSKRKRGSIEADEEATPDTGKQRSEAGADKAGPARSKRRKHSPSEDQAQASPVTPASATKSNSSRSSTRNRKALNEELILLEDTPRRCRPKQVKVLFSHSLDNHTVEQQKKMMKKLHFQTAETVSDCTHFVTDMFLRTANMLEALAAGKPVVSTAWLENCSIAGCAIDARKFILEDSRKERENGFSMRSTFTAAQQKLLLEGMRVFVTPGIKQDFVERLVVAAGGQVVRAYDESEENCLVISCEEDRESCVPLLKKGVRIYSTEFLFSSIVSYHLDFSKNRLFVE